jgi:hypothetical protein
MRASILIAFVFITGVVSAKVVQVPIKSGVALKPNQAYTITVEAAKPTEIGWIAVQAKQCSTNCVQATQLPFANYASFATSIGGSKVYIPAAGKVSIEYKNVSAEPVKVDVFRVQRTCNAEACKFLDNTAKVRSQTYKIAAFKSITTSKDESYSVIAGTAMSGRLFTVRAVWWSDNSHAIRFSCPKFIKRYLDTQTPPEKYRPYILSGEAIGEGNNIVWKFVDACVPSAPNYGVAEDHVFK